MASTPELEALRKGIVSFGLTVRYLHEVHTLGRGVAAQNLRLGLKREGLWLGAPDECFFHSLREGAIDFEEVQRSICSFERTGYDGRYPPEGAQ
jgi:hypothetical protein